MLFLSDGTNKLDRLVFAARHELKPTIMWSVLLSFSEEVYFFLKKKSGNHLFLRKLYRNNVSYGHLSCYRHLLFCVICYFSMK